MHTSSRSLLRPFLSYATSSTSTASVTVSVPLFCVPAVASSTTNRASNLIRRRKNGSPYSCRRSVTTSLSRLALPSGLGDAVRPGRVSQRKHGDHSIQLEALEDATVVPYTPVEGGLFQSGSPNASLETSDWKCHRREHRTKYNRKATSGSARAYSTVESHLPPESNRHIPYWWIKGLEPSLPSNLRSQEDASHQSRPLFSHDQLVIYLKTARVAYGVDVLEFLGCKQKRWKAVIWVVRHLLDSFPTGVRNTLFGRGTLSSSLQIGQLDDVTTMQQQLRFDILGQIWASLGSMIISASRQHHEEARKEAMSYVLQIIAQLHHADCVPDLAYNYTHLTQSDGLRRPPTLHYLSSRILTSLSDAAWRAHEQHVAAEAASVGAQYTYLGHEVPGARYKLKVRELGPEIWLELVLWCCVEAGFIREGAWIIAKLMQAAGTHQCREYGRVTWNSVDWNTMQSPNVTGERKRSAMVDWGRIRRRPGRVFTMAEGYSAEPPVVEMGDKTISSEVVAFLVDGLVDLLCLGQANGNADSLRGYLGQIRTLKAFLEESRGVDLISWEQIIFRIADCIGPRLEVNPWILEEITKLAAESQKAKEDDALDASCISLDCVPDRSLMIELWQRMVVSFATTDHIWGSLRAWDKLQSSVDLHKWALIKEFLSSEIQAPPELEDNTPKGYLTMPQKRLQACKIPIPVIAAFLNVTTDNGFFEVGRWLLYNDDIDGPLISEDIYWDSTLEPALLNFASATGDTELRSKLIEGMLSQPIWKMKRNKLSSILGCEIGFGSWDSVERILDFIASKRRHFWTVSEFAKLVVVVLKLERKLSRTPADAGWFITFTSLERAKAILGKLLRGDYGMAGVPSIYDIKVSSAEDFMDVLRQVAHSALPHRLHHQLGISNESKREKIGHIPTNAFNTLLRGVVETRGSKQAYLMWHTWCQSPDDLFGEIDSQLDIESPSRLPALEVLDESMMFERSRTGQGTAAELGLLWQSESVRAAHLFARHRKGRVVPSLGTLRILLQGAQEERRTVLDGTKDQLLASTNATTGSVRLPNHEMKVQGEHNPEVFEHSTAEELGDLIRWGDDMFRFFGLSEAEIAQEHALTKLAIPSE